LNGGLAKTEHGFFSIYPQFNRWYIDYERGAARYGDGNGMPLTLHGVLTLDAAKATAEKYAKSLDVSEVVGNSVKSVTFSPWLATALRLTVAGPAPRSKDHQHAQVLPRLPNDLILGSGFFFDRVDRVLVYVFLIVSGTELKLGQPTKF
jgi:hypothetical protein